MENLNNSQWRSTDSNSDNLDESATETINSSFLSCNTQKDPDDIDSEDGLSNAMNNLQITTAKRSEQLDHSNATTKINVDEENEPIDKKIDNTQENTLQKSTKMNNKLNSFKTFIKPQTIKSKLTVPTKTTLLPPPDLSKSKIIMNTSLNTSVSKNNKNLKETDKRIIKKVVNTDEGIELREEKINHFSIPIIDGKKKSTAPIGFSFLSKVKKPATTINNNEVEKKAKTGVQPTNKNISLCNQRKTVVRSKSASTINRNQNTTKSSELSKTILTSRNIKRATTTSSLPAVKNAKNLKASVNVLTTKKVNQENKSPNENGINKPKIQHQFGKTLTPKLHTDQRAKKRHEFDFKLKQKEIEIEKIRLQLEKKQREKEKLEEQVLRKTMEHKAIPVPEFKVPAPIRSKKPLTVPQSPAWVLKAKQAK